MCAGNSISEYDDKIPADLTAEEILIRSGNIGSARIAEKIGIDNFKKFLKSIGILDNIILLVIQWSRISNNGKEVWIHQYILKFICF